MNQQKTHLFDLPREIFEKIVDYVPFQDMKSLANVNKGLNKLLTNAPNYYPKQIYHNIIQCSSKVENSWSISCFEGYHIPSEEEFSAVECAEDFLQKRSLFTHQLGSFFGQGSGNEEKANSLLKKVWRILLDPMLPEPILKRDIHNFETESYFQTFLTDYYHGILLPPRKDAHREFMSSFVNSIPDPDAKTDSIKWMRWYNVEKLADIDENQETPLVVFYVRLVRFFVIHCRILASYLNSISDDQNFLKEYIRTWKEYSLSCQEFHHLFESLSEKIQQVYQNLYPEHFQYPKFAFWRLFTKIFLLEVYNRLSERLYRSYHETFARRLVDKILKSDVHADAKKAIALTANQEEFEGEVPEKCDFMIKNGMLALEDISLNEYSVFYNQLDSFQSNDASPKFSAVEQSAAAMSEVLEAVFNVVDPTRDLRSIMNVMEDFFGEVFNAGTSNFMCQKLINFVVQKNVEKVDNTLTGLLEEKNGHVQFNGASLDKKVQTRQARGYVEIRNEYKPYFNLFEVVDPDNLHIQILDNENKIQNDRILVEA